MMTFPFRPGGSSCMVCGTDLWDVERYASAGAVVICQACVDVLKRAMDDADGTGEIEVTLPPRVHGDAPDAEAAMCVARAFVRTFGSEYDDLDDYLEDAAELGPLLRQGAVRFGPAAHFTGRVNALRFPRPDVAEVRFQILMNGNPTGWQFEGTAARRDGKWRVTRDTVARVLRTTGVDVPLRPA